MGDVLPRWIRVLLHPSDLGRNDSALLVNKSIDGGLHWSRPITLIEEDSTFNVNDKNSITADPFDSRYGYAIWDRSNFPSDKREAHSIAGFPRSVRSDAMFSRTTDGGKTWEKPRAIFAPQANEFSIRHQIVVLSDGTLLDPSCSSTALGRKRRARRSR